MHIVYLTSLVILCHLSSCLNLTAQKPGTDSLAFFADDRMITVTLASDFRTLSKRRKHDIYYPASITLELPDSAVVTEEIEIRARGQLRREMCSMPPLMINFNATANKPLKNLGTLKLVVACRTGKIYDQLVLKEYAAYRIYNLLTDMSFRARLVRIRYLESSGEHKKKEPDWQYAFFIEDADDMASRNDCMEIKSLFAPEQTNRRQMTLVALFEYMIGNTDFTIVRNRNIRLIRSRTDTLSRPYVVPYDFDYSGLVNAPYAIPHPDYSDKIKHVTERLYKGSARTAEELEVSIQIFNSKKKDIDALIMNMEPLEEYNKKTMKKYIDSFFEIINDRKTVRDLFINKGKDR